MFFHICGVGGGAEPFKLVELAWYDTVVQYSKSNIQHWDRNSKFHLFFHHGYVPSLDFDDILRDKIRISRRIFWCSGFAVAPMLKKGEISVLLPKNMNKT